MKIVVTELINTPFAVLVWHISEGEEDEAKVYGGIATWNHLSESLEVRRNEFEQPILTLRGAQLDRIQKVTDEVKELLLNCEYGIPLSISDLPDDFLKDMKKSD